MGHPSGSAVSPDLVDLFIDYFDTDTEIILIR